MICLCFKIIFVINFYLLTNLFLFFFHFFTIRPLHHSHCIPNSLCNLPKGFFSFFFINSSKLTNIIKLTITSSLFEFSWHWRGCLWGTHKSNCPRVTQLQELANTARLCFLLHHERRKSIQSVLSHGCKSSLLWQHSTRVYSDLQLSTCLWRSSSATCQDKWNSQLFRLLLHDHIYSGAAT